MWENRGQEKLSTFKRIAKQRGWNVLKIIDPDGRKIINFVPLMFNSSLVIHFASDAHTECLRVVQYFLTHLITCSDLCTECLRFEDFMDRLRQAVADRAWEAILPPVANSQEPRADLAYAPNCHFRVSITWFQESETA